MNAHQIIQTARAIRAHAIRTHAQRKRAFIGRLAVTGIGLTAAALLISQGFYTHVDSQSQGLKKQESDTSVPVPNHRDQDETQLQAIMTEAREATHDASIQAEKNTKQFENATLQTKNKIEDAMRKAHQPYEPLMPNLLYVAMAGVAGGIFARRHGFLARLTWPPLFAFAASFYWLPDTTRATIGMLRDKVDDTKVRERMKQHAPAVLDTVDHAREAVSFGGNQIGESRRRAEDNVADQMARVRNQAESAGEYQTRDKSDFDVSHKVSEAIGNATAYAKDRAHQASQRLKKQAEEAHEKAEELRREKASSQQGVHEVSPKHIQQVADESRRKAEDLVQQAVALSQDTAERVQEMAKTSQDRLKGTTGKSEHPLHAHDHRWPT